MSKSPAAVRRQVAPPEASETSSALARATAFLESHSVYEKTGRIESPSTANIERLVQLLGDPHLAYR
ncbi:MAG: hypothetical protein ACO4AZ_07425, partial [Ilumatobacteraceae bacterium]